MALYRAQSGMTVLKTIDEITSLYCSCYRLSGERWFHIGNTEPVDPEIKEEVLDKLFFDMVEDFDTRDFDLDSCLEILDEKELLEE